MNDKTKREVIAKARLAYGLLTVLKEDIDNLRMDLNECD